MPDRELVATHYTRDGLLEAISAGVMELGKTLDTVRVEDLGPVDEFHIGGRIATENFLNQVALSATDQVLDIGCGLGGASRFTAAQYGCVVAGIDLTREYIDCGQILCEWVDLDRQVSLVQGDATAIPFPDNRFDKAYMLHVGMNIGDKAALAAEVHRVLKPGGTFGIYDIMRVDAGELNYPVPWATSADGSALGSPEEYKQVLQLAGFGVKSERNRRDFALDFFARQKAASTPAVAPPPLGLHILMGDTAPVKLRNMIRGISENQIAPIEIIAHCGA